MEDAILFENESLLEEGDIKKFLSHITLKQRMFSLFVGIIGIILAIVEYRSDNKTFAIILAIIGVFAIASFFALVKTTLRNMEKSGRLNVNIKIQFYMDKIIVYENEEQMDMNYIDIMDMINNDDTFYLMMDKNRGIIIKKNSFTEGTVEEFEKFMDTKIVKGAPKKTYGG